MIKAALLSIHPIEKCKRQLPNARADFDSVEFFVPVDEAEIVFVFDALPETANRFNYLKVVLERPVPTVFIAAEPKSVKQYNPAFLSQFSAVITSDRETPHPCRIFTQQAIPWHVGTRSADGKVLDVPMSFEELENHNPRKTKLVSVVSSDKCFTAGHRARLAFVAKLKEALGDEVDVFGRGINGFGDKREVLDDYRYHIAIENCAAEDYWTEKLADPYLTQTFPIYHGCPNIADYFSEKAMRVIDIYQPERAIEIIREVINSDLAEKSKEHLLEARRKVMYEHNLFALLAKVAKELLVEQNHSEKRYVKVLYPERHFDPFVVKLKRWLRHIIRKLPMLEKTLRFLMAKFLDWKHRHHRRWFADSPKDELRFQYDLPPGASILDVGGYNGDFAARFIELCNANVTIFEPVSTFASKIKVRFAGEKRVCIHEAGLSDKDEIVDFYINADASSVFDASEGEKVRVALWDAEQFLEKCDTDEWHLAKLNIEGGEYALLRRLIDTRRIEKFQYLQIQFQLNVPDAKKQYRKLAARLQHTHRLQWRYPFVWESWRRRDIHETRTGSND